jgi:hypothetical protein
MPQVRQIVRDAAADNYRFFDLIRGVVNSDAFRLQAAPHDESAGTSTVAWVHPAK